MTLENEKLRITISTFGAELSSLFSKDKQQEFLWSGLAEWWPRRAPVLFPIVGKLNDNSFRHNGNIYSLSQHGFARDNEFKVESESATAVTLMLSSSKTLLEKFPFDFKLRITYEISDSTVEVKYNVENLAHETMYFSIGAHPGFAFKAGEILSDYFIEFEQPETLDRYLLQEGVFSGATERVITNSNKLKLNDEMMKKDAIVFKNMKSTTLWLKSMRSDYSLKFSAADFPYFGIWAKPGGPFVCLEPWCGMADNKGYSSELKNKEGIISLGAGDTFTRNFFITV